MVHTGREMSNSLNVNGLLRWNGIIKLTGIKVNYMATIIGTWKRFTEISVDFFSDEKGVFLREEIVR